MYIYAKKSLFINNFGTYLQVKFIILTELTLQISFWGLCFLNPKKSNEFHVFLFGVWKDTLC